MGAEVQAAIGPAYQTGWLLQAPVLTAALDLAAAQLSAPGAVLQLARQGQGAA